MRNQLLLLTIFWMGCLLPKSLFAVEMTSQTIEYLDAYGKVWGFLKYINPQLDSESWNQLLLNDYDKVKQITSDDQFSIVMDKLLKEGENSLSSSSNMTTEQIAQNNALAWINTPRLAPYKERLHKIAITSQGKGGFTNISTKTFNTEAERYWAWSVIWNVLNYEDPDLALSTQQWHQMFSKQLPSFISAKDNNEVYKALDIQNSRNLLNTA